MLEQSRGNMKAIGDKIRLFRKQKGLTQSELADKVGVSVMSIRRYEGGERVVTYDVLRRIAEVLCIPVENLIRILKGSFVSAETFPADTPKETIMQTMQARAGLQEQFITEQAVAFALDPQGERIIFAFQELNEKGKQEAARRMEELSMLRQFNRISTPDSPSTPDDDTTEAPTEPE